MTQPLSSPATATAQIQLDIPTVTSQSAMRAPEYVSPSTNSLSITVNNAAPTIISLPSYAGCTTTANGRSCVIGVSLPTGSITLALSTFASSDASGSALAIGTSTATITPGLMNTIPIALHPIAHALTLTLTPNTLTVGTAATSSVTISALDAAGTVIAAGAPLVDASNSPLTMNLADSDTSGATSIAAPNADGLATLSYNGNANVPDLTISAAVQNASGATIASTSAPLAWHRPGVGPVVASVAALTFTATGTAQSFTVSQSHYTGAFAATASGGDPTAVTVTLAGSNISVMPLHAGSTSILVTGGNAQTISVPVNITTSILTFQ